VELSNQEIWLAYPNLVILSKLRLPFKASMGIAALMSGLRDPFSAIERKRLELVAKYGEHNDKTRQTTVAMDGKNAAVFAKEFGELLMPTRDWELNKVTLPETILAACDKCKHKVEVPILIEPNLLLPLQKFLEVK